jgi:hypothetical protein
MVTLAPLFVIKFLNPIKIMVKNLRISSNKKNTIRISLNTKKEKKKPMNRLGMSVAFNGFSLKFEYKKYNPIYPVITER